MGEGKWPTYPKIQKYDDQKIQNNGENSDEKFSQTFHHPEVRPNDNQQL